ncbi:peptidylprolyl isomerase [Hellea balneolensis]|uniref:peptidylprolyl isomerase n=1 Tax=Hellea balneolensis TaxID=287478 RepID=UPI000426AF93|nr:peptidylprolyl isomerase [Hellea balneolensis]
MRALFLSAVCLAVSACGPKIDTSPNVILETEMGLIEIETYPQKAPASAGDFLNYVDRGYYNGEGFYRVVRADNDPRNMGMSLIQGGRLDTEPKGDPIVHEPTSLTGLRNDSGTVSIARDAPGTGSAAYFFINIGDNNFLDEGGERNPDGAGYATFGKVVKGMDVIKAIQAGKADAPTEEEVVRGQYLTRPVIIKKAYRK